MANDDLIAALEWAVGQAQGCQADEVFVLGQLLTDLHAGNLVRREDVVAQERAKVVAYLRRVGLTPKARDLFATAAGHIAAGAHEGGGDE